MDFHNEHWHAIVTWATQQLQTEREKNDGVERDAMQTAFIRGRISMLKELLALPKTKAPLVSDVEPE